MKLLDMLCRATQDRWVMVESSDKCGPLEKGMANHLTILALRTPWTVMKRQKDRTLKDELPRSVGAQYATGDQWRNNPRKNEEMEPNQKQHPVVDVTGYVSKVWCCKEQYCIGTWKLGLWIESGQTGDGKSEYQHFRSQFREGNGNPLQYSCLENPMDGGA